MEAIMKSLRCLDKILLGTLKTITITCFVFLTLLITANVFVRFFPIVSLHWFDEIIELLYAYLVFYGAAALWINREHLCVGDWISGRLIKSNRAISCYKLMLEVIGLMFTLIFFYYSTRLTSLALDVTNAFGIPKKILYSCMSVSGAIMVAYSIRNCVVEILRIAKPKAE